MLIQTEKWFECERGYKSIKKADRAKCPKNSYLVGKDAFVASVFQNYHKL